MANDQRRVIYQQRNDILEAEGFIDQITSLRHGAVEDLVRTYVPVGSVEEQWDLQALQTQLAADWAIQVDLAAHVAQSEAIDDDDLVQLVIEQADAVFNDKLSRVGEDNLMQFARMVLLQVLDSHWRDHLSALDYLRQGIHLRGYAQKQPKQEYKREAFELFGRMLDGVRDEVTRIMLTVRVDEPDAVAEATDQMEQQANHVSQMTYSGPDEQGNAQVTGEPSVSHEAGIPRVGRNEPCPCGSGKKYKQCHGKL